MEWGRYLRRGTLVPVAVIVALVAACGDDGHQLSTQATEASTH